LSGAAKSRPLGRLNPDFQRRGGAVRRHSAKGGNRPNEGASRYFKFYQNFARIRLEYAQKAIRAANLAFNYLG
jgi:hypothetical protein